MMSVRMALMPALFAALVLVLAGCGREEASTFQGWVEADLVFISPDEPGRIEDLVPREGEMVTAGARLFAVDAELQKADLAAAEAASGEARARLERLEGEQQRPAEIAVLEAQRRRLAASLTLSTAERERQRQLAEKAISSKAQFDTAEANFRRDEAALEEIGRQIDLAHLPARDEDIAAARQAHAAAEARRQAAATRLARRTVASPVAGLVHRIYYRVGEMVPSGRSVMALLPPGNLKIRFFVSQSRLPAIATGQMVEVQCDGCAGGMRARIDFIASTAEYTPPVVYTPEERARLVYLVEARPLEAAAMRVGQPVRVVPAGAAP